MLARALLFVPPALPVPSWTYWRIYITANVGGDSENISIHELELAASAGSADLTSPGLTTDESSYMTGRTFDFAIDNNTSSSIAAWLTDQNAPQWGWVQLAAKTAISELRLLCHAVTSGPEQAPKDFIVQGSDNGTDWTDVQSFSGVTGWVVGTWRAFNLITGSHT